MNPVLRFSSRYSLTFCNFCNDMLYKEQLPRLFIGDQSLIWWSYGRYLRSDTGNGDFLFLRCQSIISSFSFTLAENIVPPCFFEALSRNGAASMLQISASLGSGTACFRSLVLFLICFFFHWLLPILSIVKRANLVRGADFWPERSSGWISVATPTRSIKDECVQQTF